MCVCTPIYHACIHNNTNQILTIINNTREHGMEEQKKKHSQPMIPRSSCLSIQIMWLVVTVVHRYNYIPNRYLYIRYLYTHVYNLQHPPRVQARASHLSRYTQKRVVVVVVVFVLPSIVRVLHVFYKYNKW